MLFVGSVFSRKRWVRRQPGAFRGAIRLAKGEHEGIAPSGEGDTVTGSETS